MAWKKKGALFDIIGIQGFVNCNVQWIFRGFSSVFCIDPIKLKILWKKNFPNDHSFGYKPLLELPNSVLTSSHNKGKSSDIYLIRLESSSGKVLWKRKVNWTLNQNLGGLLTGDGNIAFFEDIESPKLVLIDHQNRERTFHAQDFSIIASGKYQKGPHTSIMKGKCIFGCFSTEEDEGLIFMDLKSSPSSINKIIEGDCTMIASIGNDVFCLLVDEDRNKILQIDPLDGSLLRTYKLPKNRDVAQMIPSDVEHVKSKGFFLCFDEFGIAYFDLRKGKIKWSLGQKEEWNVTDITHVPFGIVILIESLEETIICTIDSSSGTVISTVSLNDVIRGKIFWTGKNLIYCSSRGLEVFEWES